MVFLTLWFFDSFPYGSWVVWANQVRWLLAFWISTFLSLFAILSYIFFLWWCTGR